MSLINGMTITRGMSVHGEMAVRRAGSRIDQQRRTGNVFPVSEERRHYVETCKLIIVAGTAAQDRADRIRWTQSFQNSDIGGAA